MNPAITDRHLSTAIVQLGRALHYHRFFGQPLDGLSPEHNASRARVNALTVAAYARAAGQFAAYAQVPPLSPTWACSEVASFALAVPSIYEHFVAGYVDTEEDLGEPTVPMRRDLVEGAVR